VESRHPAPAPARSAGDGRTRDGEAIGTSGDYQRFFEVAGKRYPHLLDPRTGYPADHTQAVTVLIPAGPKAGTLSDAASKPIFIAGPDGWRAMAKKWKLAWFYGLTATVGFSSPKPSSSAWRSSAKRRRWLLYPENPARLTP
jgi:thiamine biosynthesis lipoprotein ApbE